MATPAGLGYALAPVSRRRNELGTLYRGREGQWSWIAHRVTGVGILLFLFAHIIDTAMLGWGPETYNKVVALYHNPIVEIMELGLVAAVIYHAVNGIRIMIIDFWPQATLHHRRLTWATLTVFVAAMAPITYLMGRRILEGLF